MLRRSAAILLLISLCPLSGHAQTTPAWPSLAEQLRKDHVIPGSALERLIRENQDFGQLRPEEANDDLGIPPWLRVLIRKAHPEGIYAASDPTGGYPLWLGDIHRWMVTHQDLRTVSSQKSRAEASSSILSGPPAIGITNRRISGDQASPREESNIKINPSDPNFVVAASNSLPTGDRAQAQFFSTDGGRSWSQTSLPRVLDDFAHGDPSVDWTSPSTAWSLTLGIDATFTSSRLRAYSSTSPGLLWTFDATASGGSQTAVDKPMMWVDHGPLSSFRDRIYAIWYLFGGGGAYLNYRTGPSGSWQTPQLLSGTETAGAPIVADVKTNSYGDVLAFWTSPGNHQLFVRKSADGGVSFASPVQLPQGTFAFFHINYRLST